MNSDKHALQFQLGMSAGMVVHMWSAGGSNWFLVMFAACAIWGACEAIISDARGHGS